MKDPKILEFLNAQSKNTKNTYATYMKRLLEFTKQSGSQILEESGEWKRKIFAFQNWLKEKGYSSYYIQSCCGCVRGFFSFYDKPLMLSTQDRIKLGTKTRTTQDFNFDNETLHRAWLCSTVKGRYVIAVGKSLGLRAEDFAKITYGMLRSLDLNAELPIFLGTIDTSKEGVKAYCYLDYDAVQSIKDLLAFYPNKPDNEKVWTARSEDLNGILQRACEKAKIEHGDKRIRFHCLRKFLIDRLSMYSSESQWKQIVGKKISESAYISHLQLREVYRNAMHSIRFNGDITRKRLSTLEEIIKEKDARIRELEAQLAKTNESISKMTIQLQDFANFQNEVEKKLKLKQHVKID